MAGQGAGERVRIGALRCLLYHPGSWNDNRPFGYDLTDPDGHSLKSQLLPNYLLSRRGNCVSMPILFLILAERLSLDVRLALAPQHMFVRYHVPSGPIINLETTSGANPARDSWYRQNFPITDEAVRNRVYLRSLSKKETVAAMAATVVEHLVQNGRFEEAADVCGSILRHAPLDVFAMVKLATAYGALIERDFETRYPKPVLIPAGLRRRYLTLRALNRRWFERAQALGWGAT